MLFYSVSRRVSRAGIRLHHGRRPRPQETRDKTDGRTDNWVLGWPASRRGHESFPLRGPSSPGPQARESRPPPRIGLTRPAEGGHLSPPLLSWQLCLCPQGWAVPRGRAARCLGDPYCVPYRSWGPWLYSPAVGLMIPQSRDSAAIDKRTR